MSEYSYNLEVLDLLTGIKSQDAIVIDAPDIDAAERDLLWYIDFTWPENEFEVSIYPDFEVDDA